MTKPVPPFAEWYATKEAEAKALDRATQALKDASVAYFAALNRSNEDYLLARSALMGAAEDYAEAYLKRGGK